MQVISLIKTIVGITTKLFERLFFLLKERTKEEREMSESCEIHVDHQPLNAFLPFLWALLVILVSQININWWSIGKKVYHRMRQFLQRRFASQGETESDQNRINNLPPEMVEKILKLLNFKEICRAKVICRQWKEIIDNGNLMQNASGNILNQ